MFIRKGWKKAKMRFVYKPKVFIVVLWYIEFEGKKSGIAIENHTLSQKNIPPPVKMTKIQQKVQNG